MELRKSPMEGLVVKPKFWKGKKVFITGHTGFKGGWMAFWLNSLGAEVYGYALKPKSELNFFYITNIQKNIKSVFADITNSDTLKKSLREFGPDIVIHMAAQSLVRYSYKNPIETYETNIMGSIKLMDALRDIDSVKVFLNVTSDKCYENKENNDSYTEDQPMGGYDPYSSSKACSELITTAYRRSYFNNELNSKRLAVATARAGNVIGGGDWSEDRLIPDLIRAIDKNKDIEVRNPLAVRPWQHVFDALHGYMILIESLYANDKKFSEAWNFGPLDNNSKNVRWIVESLVKIWGSEANIICQDGKPEFHEAHYLQLNSLKANKKLNWSPKINIENSLKFVCSWHKAHLSNENMEEYSFKQIQEFTKLL